VDLDLILGYNKDMRKTSVFISPTKGKLTLGKLLKEITGFVDEDSGARYSLVIGTDSHNTSADHKAEFVTAIVIHRVGRGGRYFWTKNKRDKIYTLRDKIYTETLLSLDLAQNLVPELKAYLKKGNGGYELEIHIDVGEFGETREMIREVVGMVAGNGFKAKTKPESYGAFVVADRYT
jgi:predicted RNase H-related nuclease YkuK (DUF458 family)